jgi:4-hydroxy-2-oxoheptanedioate aldolase
MPATVRNVAREKLEQGQLSLGVGVRMTRSVEIAKAMAVAGFDWLFLDMEHGVMSLEACAQISTAALDAGIAPIARVPNGEYAIATRALDNGALGIVMPHVDSAAEAHEVVNRLKIRRSVTARWAASDHIMGCVQPARARPQPHSTAPI